MGSAAGGRRSFADVLNDLCAHPVTRSRPYSNAELARIVRDCGGDLTHSYVAALRKGDKGNPTRQTIEDLAAALGVHPACFVGGRSELRPGERPRWRREALGHLLRHVHPPNRGPWSPSEVATAISRDGRHGSISGQYIRELLSGESDNPRLKHILALADHFGAPPAYWFDDDLARQVDAELAEFVALRDAGVVSLVTRLAETAPELRPQTRQAAIRAITDALERGTDTRWVFGVGSLAGTEETTDR